MEVMEDEMIEFFILGEVRRVVSRADILAFQRADFDLFGRLAG